MRKSVNTKNMHVFNAGQPNLHDPVEGVSLIDRNASCKLCKTQHFFEYTLLTFMGLNFELLQKLQNRKKQEAI